MTHGQEPDVQLKVHFWMCRVLQVGITPVVGCIAIAKYKTSAKLYAKDVMMLKFRVYIFRLYVEQMNSK